MAGRRQEITRPLAKNKRVAWSCREQAGCWITPAAGTRRQQIAWYAGTHNSGGGGGREAGRDFARQTGKGWQKKFLWAFFLYFVKSKIANYWRCALFLLGI